MSLDFSTVQRAKKVVSDSPGLVDFAIGLVFFVLNLPNGQVLFFGGNSNYRRIVINPANQKGFWGFLQLARMAGCETDFLCTLTVQNPL